MGDQASLHMGMFREVKVRVGTMLRPMQDGDGKDLLEIMDRDPNIRERVTVAANMPDFEGVKKQVAAYKNDPALIRYVIVQNGEISGLVSLWRDEGFFGQPPLPYTYGFGFFVDPKKRGQHLAADAVMALMSEMEEYYRVDTFIAFCENDNPASQAVLKRVGMTPTEQHFAEPTHDWTEYMWRKDL